VTFYVFGPVAHAFSNTERTYGTSVRDTRSLEGCTLPEEEVEGTKVER